MQDKELPEGQTPLSFTEMSFSIGPVPDPYTLAKYEAVSAGFADRLMTIAELEQKNRHALLKEEQSIQHRILNIDEQQIIIDSSAFKKGQLFAFLSLLIVVGLCVYAFYLGHAREAMYTAIGVIVSVVGIFITKKIAFPKFDSKK